MSGTRLPHSRTPQGDVDAKRSTDHCWDATRIGAIAVGVGNLLKAQHEGQIQMNGGTAGSMQRQLQGRARHLVR